MRQNPPGQKIKNLHQVEWPIANPVAPPVVLLAAKVPANPAAPLAVQTASRLI